MTSIRIASARGDIGIAAYEREIAEHSESQRAMVGAKIATLKNGQRPSAIAEGMPQGEAAKRLNVSPDSIGRARAVLDSGTPELIEAVERDEVNP
ncbi:MAG: hypothetical protein ABSF35_24120 [Polyangia bacterium]|jgi:hypothetical protein